MFSGVFVSQRQRGNILSWSPTRGIFNGSLRHYHHSKNTEAWLERWGCKPEFIWKLQLCAETSAHFVLVLNGDIGTVVFFSNGDEGFQFWIVQTNVITHTHICTYSGVQASRAREIISWLHHQLKWCHCRWLPGNQSQSVVEVRPPLIILRH